MQSNTSQITTTQDQALTALMSGVENYFDQLINYTANDYQSATQLANDPEAMDQLLNYYRAKDACFTYLIAPWERKLGHYLDELSKSELDNFLAIHDPQDIANFFCQDNILEDYTMANEHGKPDAFKNDPKFEDQYQKFLKTGSVANNPINIK